MSTQSSNEIKNNMTAIEEEKGTSTPAIDQAEDVFDIDSEDLPKGYFLRPYFLGTLLASGLSMSAVRILP
jgi:DNA primase catalytic subunit